MTTDVTEQPTLSPQTQASVQGLVRAKTELAAWTKNLEQALADDLAADPPRLTHEQAAAVAKDNDVEAPKAPAKAHKEEEPKEAHASKEPPEEKADAGKSGHHDPGPASRK